MLHFRLFSVCSASLLASVSETIAVNKADVSPANSVRRNCVTGFRPIAASTDLQHRQRRNAREYQIHQNCDTNGLAPQVGQG